MHFVSSQGGSVGESLFHQTAVCSVWRWEVWRGPSGADSRTSGLYSESTCCLPSEGVKGSIVHAWLVTWQKNSIILYVPCSKLGCLGEPGHVSNGYPVVQAV